eukprot:1391457-Rhodomonas_salina.1
MALSKLAVLFRAFLLLLPLPPELRLCVSCSGITPIPNRFATAGAFLAKLRSEPCFACTNCVHLELPWGAARSGLPSATCPRQNSSKSSSDESDDPMSAAGHALLDVSRPFLPFFFDFCSEPGRNAGFALEPATAARSLRISTLAVLLRSRERMANESDCASRASSSAGVRSAASKGGAARLSNSPPPPFMRAFSTASPIDGRLALPSLACLIVDSMRRRLTDVRRSAASKSSLLGDLFLRRWSCFARTRDAALFRIVGSIWKNVSADCVPAMTACALCSRTSCAGENSAS